MSEESEEMFVHGDVESSAIFGTCGGGLKEGGDVDSINRTCRLVYLRHASWQHLLCNLQLGKVPLSYIYRIAGWFAVISDQLRITLPRCAIKYIDILICAPCLSTPPVTFALAMLAFLFAVHRACRMSIRGA